MVPSASDERGWGVITHRVHGGGGLELRVDETGNPDGRPILFIHGFSQCRLSWRRQLGLGSELTGRYRLVALDNRGHGDSAKPPDVYGDSKLWADDLAAIIDQLGLDHPVLVGWSYGGVTMADYVSIHGEDAIAGTTFIRICGHDEPAPDDFFYALGYNTIVPPHVRRALFARTVDHTDVLRGLTTPALVTHGVDDTVVRPTSAEAIAATVPDAELSLYDGAGHAPFLEAPDRFNAELAAFVDRL